MESTGSASKGRRTHRASAGDSGPALGTLHDPLMIDAVRFSASDDDLRRSSGQDGRRGGGDDDEGVGEADAPRRRVRRNRLASLLDLRDFLNETMWSSDSNRFYARPAGDTTRLVVRDYPFHQSSGKLNMAFVIPREARQLFSYDMFHFLVQSPTKLLLLLVCTTYTAVVLAFTLIYMLVDSTDPTCHLGLDDTRLTFHTAFAFAVETQATIGYGIPSEGAAYFSGCPTLPIVVYCHALIVWILNAALIGGTLARLSRANLRAVEIVFSDKACVQCIRGDFYLRFQVAELSYFRFHPAVEAHVRCYAVLHETDSDAQVSCPFQTRHMRLTHPDDTRGAMLFLPVPSAIMHGIDEWSPLYPPVLARHRRRRENQLDPQNAATRELWRWPHITGYSFPGIVQRAADLETMQAVRELAEQQRAPQEAAEPQPRAPPPGAPRLRPLRSGATASCSSGNGGGPSGAGGTPAVAVHHGSASPQRTSPVRGACSSGSADGSPVGGHRSRSGSGSGSGCGCCSGRGCGCGSADAQAHPAQGLAGVRGLSRVESAVAMDRLGLSSIGGPAMHLNQRNSYPPFSQPSQSHGAGGGTSACGTGSAPTGGAGLGDAAAARFQEELRAHVARSDVEVVVLVEAIDPQTSNTFQARHSYKVQSCGRACAQPHACTHAGQHLKPAAIFSPCP